MLQHFNVDKKRPFLRNDLYLDVVSFEEVVCVSLAIHVFFLPFTMPFSSEKVNFETKRKCRIQTRVQDLQLHSSTLAVWSRTMHRGNLNERSKTDVPFHGDTLLLSAFSFFKKAHLK